MITSLRSRSDVGDFQDPQVKKTKLAAELANGRLAMVALMAMWLWPYVFFRWSTVMGQR